MAVEQATGTVESLRRSELAAAIRRGRLVAIMRRLPPAVVDPTVEALLAGGVAVFEFTADSEGALASIARWRAAGRAFVGAGTVRHADTVDAVVDAGAQFVVAPTYDESVVERSLELGVPCLPGALSPSEVDAAWQQGATFVKLFPGAPVGAGYVKALLAPLRDVELVVTGGIDESSARSYIDAGAVAVGVSTSGLGQPADAAGDFAALAATARRLLDSLA
ncbi:MAG: bifunctional 4-hydroxy-2-oxoglutarate aldolase/2-dehydro-3-deoxy-phosphogluconate aldolase [Thermoleophilia bacterium]|nr:bifunctional 4-hydroxy-2-oxoglutarate aldolase/2-dehydro-3-deoxy-phosphogluconate aldolase [Thermoleophilia bacterium]